MDTSTLIRNLTALALTAPIALTAWGCNTSSGSKCVEDDGTQSAEATDDPFAPPRCAPDDGDGNNQVDGNNDGDNNQDDNTNSDTTGNNQDDNSSNNQSDNNNPNGATNNTTGGENNDNNTPQPEVGALRFEPIYGLTAKQQFDPVLQTSAPGYSSDGEVVVLLCATSDPTCTAPLQRFDLDKTDPETWEQSTGGDPVEIIFSAGPTLTVPNVPAGNYLMMVLEDSVVSQARGEGAKDTYPGQEEAWGGAASTSDLMLSAEEPRQGYNPPPVALAVTVTTGETTELGTLNLGHYHELSISPTPRGENARVVIAVPDTNSVRLIDLNTFTLVPAFEQGDVRAYDYVLAGEDGLELEAQVCNVIPGPGKSVFVIYAGGPQGTAGYAALFDPLEGQQVTTNLVTFPTHPDAEDGPCRTIYHESGGEGYLFALSSGGTNDAPKPGFWYARVSDLTGGSITAGTATELDDPLFEKDLVGVQARGDALYIGTLAVLDGCNTRDTKDSCVFRGTFDPTDGRPIIERDAGDPTVFKTGDIQADVDVLGLGTVRCSDGMVPAGILYFGMKVVTFKKTGQDLLLVGNCHEINMFDLDTGAQLDFNPVKPGPQGFDATLYGGGYYGFELGPDGDAVYATPANKSQFPFFSALAGRPDNDRFQTDRHTMLVLDVSAGVEGDLPVAKAEFGDRDQDDFAGLPESYLGALFDTPANDPGIDLRAFYLREYIYGWNDDLTGIVAPGIPVGATCVVGRNTVWVRGAGEPFSGESGIAGNGDVRVLDLSAKEVVLFGREGRAIHGPFTDLAQRRSDFDIAPDINEDLPNVGMVYIELP